VEVELTSLLYESEPAAVEFPRWDLAPSVARVDAIDAALRLRLVDSLDYLAEVASLDRSLETALASVEESLKAAPVSPWVFCLYSKLVAELSKTQRGDAAALFQDIARAASLPAHQGVVAFRDPANPVYWWDHFQLLLDTDRQRPFRPKAPSSEAFELCHEDVKAGLALLRRTDPIWHDEVLRLVKMIVIAAPGSGEPADLFNGASTFFLWGAALLNGDFRRSSIAIVDLLVHESSHILLFGVSAEGSLTHNSGHERYESPVRPDRRSIDGIFHACFVSTRVHLALDRLLASGALNGEETKVAMDRRQYNGNSARVSLGVLDRHAKPTELGEKILDTLRAYWGALAN
jgi:HEXXH motif-containing protein